ncbi:MAG: hypothetical protein H7A46_21165 [Verrucomicrobiales bacterium]|nr:hypothetical protein [Verrucomicrobiales bacterium]
MQPGGPYYLGQWMWDTMFVVDLLALLPGTRQVIPDIFRDYCISSTLVTMMLDGLTREHRLKVREQGSPKDP